MPLNELLEPDTVYAAPHDVERYFRATTFDDTSEPTITEVEEAIRDASETVDSFTNRAWRERRSEGHDLRVKFNRKQKKSAKRRRSNGLVYERMNRWGSANLFHTNIRQPDSAEGDSFVVLKPTGTLDITDDYGRDEDYEVSQRRGTLRVRMGVFRAGPIRGSGLQENTRMRVSYRYGRDPSTSTPDYPDSLTPTIEVAEVPRDIRKATAMLVATDLIDSDSYADLVPGGDAAPDQDQSATDYEERAYDLLREYRYHKVV